MCVNGRSSNVPRVIRRQAHTAASRTEEKNKKTKHNETKKGVISDSSARLKESRQKEEPQPQTVRRRAEGRGE